jgi:hypothetical protein
MESPGGQFVGSACPDRLGGTIFLAAIQFPADKILAIPNRDELTAFEGFLEADLASEKVAHAGFTPNSVAQPRSLHLSLRDGRGIETTPKKYEERPT